MPSSGDEDKRPLVGSTADSAPSFYVGPGGGANQDTAVVPIEPIYDTGEKTFADGKKVPRFSQIRRPSRLSIALESSNNYDIALSWKDISVTVKIPGKKGFFRGETRPPSQKLILKKVTGHAAPGNLLAIMGASGSGKSTLLNVLTSRNIKDYTVSGEVLLDGVPIKSGMRNISAYVQQNDLFIETLTVREQLQFRALLRMDKRLDKKARLGRVEEVIIEMGLSNCADSRIGSSSGSAKGISGGERKRLSFASEALTNPPIFFCDEPTSSLDTFMAQSIVNTLQKMASRGRAILCTIHQPSSELFALFDKVLLLSEGRVAFMGSTQDALDFFAKQQYPCPQNYNPADHYILTLAIVPGEEEESRVRTNAICDTFSESPIAKKIGETVDELIKESDMADHIMLQEVVEGSRYTSSWFTQFTYLFWRSWTSQFRDPMLFGVRVMQTFVIGIILGLVYLQLDTDQKGVMNINGALFLIITNTCFTNLFAVLTSFPTAMAIVMREYGTGLYRIDSYYITKTLSEIPLFLGITILFGAMTYWMIGLRNDFEAFLVMIAVLLIVALISVGLGYLISIICGDTTLALSVASPILIPFMLFGGMFLNGDDVPDYFIWLDAISWFKYSNEIVMVNQWDDIDYIDCDKGRNVTFNPNMTLEEMCVSQMCQYRRGKDVLEYNSLDKDDVALDFAILGVLAVTFYVLSYFALLARARNSKE